MNTVAISSAEDQPSAAQRLDRRWAPTQKRGSALSQKQGIASDLREAFDEVRGHQKGASDLPTLSNFLESLDDDNSGDG